MVFQWVSQNVPGLSGTTREVLRDKNSGKVWLPLYQTCKGKELFVLCDGLRKPATHHMDNDIARWKTLLLVKYSLRTPEAKEHAAELVQVICDHCLRSHYSVVCAALDALSEAPVDDSVKWGALVAAIERGEIPEAGLVARKAAEYAPSDGDRRKRMRVALIDLLMDIDGPDLNTVVAELDRMTSSEDKEEMRLWLLELLYAKNPHHKAGLIERIVRLTPTSERESTAARLLGLLRRSPERLTASTILKAFDNWEYRQSIPELEKMLRREGSEVSGQMAQVLAKWEDRESAPAIRQAIDNALHQNVVPSAFDFDHLLTSLYNLEGARSLDCIAEAFLAVHPITQKDMLRPTFGVKFRRIEEKAVTNAIQKLAETTTNPVVKKAAEEYLTRREAGVPEGKILQ